MTEQSVVQPVRREQSDLNLAFLTLICRLQQRMPDSQSVLALDIDVCRRLQSLDRKQTLQIAACPFPLYGLRLDELGFWSAPAVADRESPAGEQTTAVPENMVLGVTAFTQSALLYAWHVCRVSPRRARISFGLPPRCAQHISELPITTLQQRAIGTPGLLSAALADNPRFWPDLIHCATHGNARQVQAARLLGLQLLATRGNRPPR